MSSEALYYPYTNVRSLENLKAMILYFDKIHLIDPVQASIKETQKNHGQLNILELEDVLHYISPSELLVQYDSIMTENIIADLNDQEFIKRSKANGLPQYWEIFAEKIPSGLLDSVFRKYLLNMPALYDSKKIHEYREGPFHTEISDTYGTNSRARRRETYDMLREVREDRAAEWREYRISRLDFEVGESLMINHALCASDNYDLTPITDDSIHFDFFKYKLQKTKNIGLLKNTLSDYRYIKDVNIDLSSIEVINDTLPFLANADANDVLEFRDENKDALNKFKTEMGKIVTDVEISFWDDDFRKKIVDTVDDTIKPAIQEIKDSTESVKDRFLRILSRGAKITPLPIVASIFPGINPMISLAAAAGIFVLDQYLESRKKQKEMKRNSFVFLFEAQKYLSQ